jgi:hypothetical protein
MPSQAYLQQSILEVALLYLWPVGICSDSHEEISTLEMMIDSQSILEVLDQVMAASRESRRKDGPLTQVLSFSIWIFSHNIYQALVNIRVESLLIVP